MLFGSDVANAPARLHEVPVPRQEARARRSRWSTRSASRDSSATGCRRTSRARCSARRSPTSSSRSTPAATSRSSTACSSSCSRSGGIDREFVNEHTVGFDALLAELEDESFDRLERVVGCDARRHGAGSRDMYASARARGARVVDGRHPARLAASTTCARSSTSASRAATSGAPGAGLMPIRGHSGVQGGAEMGCYATALPGRRADHRRERPPRSSAQWGFDVPDRARAHRGRRWSTRRGTAISTCCGRAAATSSTCCPRPTSRATALARTPLRIHQDIVLTPPDARRPGRGRGAAARGDALRAGGRRHVDHDRTPGRVQSRDPRAARRRGAQRVADLRRHRPPGAARPRRPSSAASRPTRSAPRSRGSSPRTRASRRLRETGDAIQVGGERLCEGGVFPTPDGKAHFAVVAPARPTTCPTAGSCCRPGAASSSTRWCGRNATRSPAPARDALFVADADAADARRRRRRRRARALAARRDARPRAPRADPARQRAGVLPGGEPVARAVACASRSRACPTTTRSSRWSRSDDVARRAARAVRRRGARPCARAVDAHRPVDRPARRTDRAASTRSISSPTTPRVACSSRLPVRIVSEESGVHEHARRRRHRRARPGRRLDELLARHLRTGPRRSARSTPTARSRRSS